ncbi:hypothetical protein [Bosea sp. BIWAKO-01]|uniref:hypothetical protein n=1 Tax=Bosea sp. BIWAKO-01 TaxID=506668 RepID=UPI000852F6A7|nr:hypothetical protein [Bosea sp. BIWAKO-01]GAU86553.1 hypothetical protein BIWAKO_06501 [Bosea sp. BIWAKO-01]
MSGKAFAVLLCQVMALVLATAPWPTQAQETPVDILFARPHLSGVSSGTELTYRLERLPSDTKRLGEPFGDDIKLVVRSVAASGSRDIDLRMYTGERARDLLSIPDLTGNPVLVIFLDRAVSNMAQLTGGTTPYFKDRLRAGLRDKATSEATKAEFEGKMLDATRIVVRPFVDDTNLGRMLGYEGSQFEFLVAEAAPGMLLDMTSRFVSTLPDAPKLEERIVLKSASARP